jgi:hypothetical protein
LHNIIWSSKIPCICQKIKKKHPNLDVVVHKCPKSDMHVQGYPCKKVLFCGHNPCCSNFLKGCRFSQNLCLSRWLFGICCKSIKHSHLGQKHTRVSQFRQIRVHFQSPFLM